MIWAYETVREFEWVLKIYLRDFVLDENCFAPRIYAVTMFSENLKLEMRRGKLGLALSQKCFVWSHRRLQCLGLWKQFIISENGNGARGEFSWPLWEFRFSRRKQFFFIEEDFGLGSDLISYYVFMLKKNILKDNGE